MTAKVCDFGLSVKLGQDTDAEQRSEFGNATAPATATSTGLSSLRRPAPASDVFRSKHYGTLSHMAPEVLLNRQNGKAADV